MIRLIFICCFGLWAGMGMAQDLTFPSNAKLIRQVDHGLESYDMPVGPWVDGTMDTHTAEGTMTQQAWQITATGLTTLQLIRPLRDQLRQDGYDVVFECRDQACGGFDFRFAIEVLPPPVMQVNLGDFWYLGAIKTGDADPEVMSVIASRSARAGYVQLTRVGATAGTAATAQGMAIRGETTTVQMGDLASNLLQNGRAILAGLAFETGSARLAQGRMDSLQSLADLLADQPELQVALVGHTDASGSLDTNIALSKRRAGSVLERLVSDYGVNRRQLEAQGMGYLSPIASNQSQDGRNANRRVEVIVTSTN